MPPWGPTCQQSSDITLTILGSPKWEQNQNGCITPAILGPGCGKNDNIEPSISGVPKAGTKSKWLDNPYHVGGAHVGKVVHDLAVLGVPKWENQNWLVASNCLFVVSEHNVFFSSKCKYKKFVRRVSCFLWYTRVQKKNCTSCKLFCGKRKHEKKPVFFYAGSASTQFCSTRQYNFFVLAFTAKKKDSTYNIHHFWWPF